jgi:hypothetical protein
VKLDGALYMECGTRFNTQFQDELATQALFTDFDIYEVMAL